jgi:hypothetical protein
MAVGWGRESNQDAETINTNHGEELQQSGDIIDASAAGIFSYKREPEGIMRVLGPTETAGLFRRALFMLPSEKIVGLDEIQILISKLDGEELREAVRNSLSPFFNEYLLSEKPHSAIVWWKINRALSLQGSEPRFPPQIF